jgi:hypothetical protein
MSNKPMKPAPSRHTGGGHNSKTCPVCNPPVSDAYRNRRAEAPVAPAA